MYKSILTALVLAIGVHGEESINTLFKAAGKKYFGTCTDQGRLSDSQNAAIIQRDFGQVTPENRLVVTLGLGGVTNGTDREKQRTDRPYQHEMGFH